MNPDLNKKNNFLRGSLGVGEAGGGLGARESHFFTEYSHLKKSCVGGG